MPSFDPELLAAWTSGRWSTELATPIGGFAIDTRQVRPGELFVALRTEKRDGHDFLEAAQSAGAGAALVARPVAGVSLPQLVVGDPLAAFQAIAREHRRRFPGKVIGVTGSAGKTSTKNLLALLLGARTLATTGNLNNHLGVPLTLTRLDPAQHDAAVIEAGISTPGEMAVLAEMIQPAVAVLTLVGHAHTEELGGLEGVAREKAVLLAAVRAEGHVLFPVGAAHYAPLRALTARRLVVTPEDAAGEARGSEALVFSTERTGDGTTLRWRQDGRDYSFTLATVSDGMAQNAVLALATALTLGADPAGLQERLRQWAPAPLRGEVRQTGEQLLYLDCYNANPASMADALVAFDRLAPAHQPRLYVLGGMEELGPESAQHHRTLGERLQLRTNDHAFVIGSDATAVREGALAAGARPDQIAVVTELGPVREKMPAFRGAVFIKGSRKYRLEEVVPADRARGAVEAH